MNDDNKNLIEMDTIIGNSIFELAGQLPLMFIMLKKRIDDYEKMIEFKNDHINGPEDDIPF